MVEYRLWKQRKGSAVISRKIVWQILVNFMEWFHGHALYLDARHVSTFVKHNRYYSLQKRQYEETR
jgi:hypothetical protein